MKSIKPVDEPDDIITHIYRGPLEGSPWQGFLHELRLRTDTDIAAMMLSPARAGVNSLTLWDCRVPPSQQGIDRAAAEHASMGYLDPLTTTLSRIGGVYTLSQLVARPELEASDFYLKLMKPYGIEHMIGMYFTEPSGWKCYVGMLNGPDKDDFGSAEKQFLLALRPHLEQALELYARLKRSELEKIIYEDAINQLGIGTIVLNGHGAVIETNQVAQEILHDHSCISLINDHLVISGAKHMDKLERLIKQALAWRDAGHSKPFVDALRVECPGESSVGLLIRNAPAEPWYQNTANPSVVVYISDLTKQLSAPEQLVARIFGLTRSEATLATLLANGASLAEAALEMKLAESSVRTYLKRVFSKVGVSRQAELVRVIVKSVALLAGSDPEPETEAASSTKTRNR